MRAHCQRKKAHRAREKSATVTGLPAPEMGTAKQTAKRKRLRGLHIYESNSRAWLARRNLFAIIDLSSLGRLPSGQVRGSYAWDCLYQPYPSAATSQKIRITASQRCCWDSCVGHILTNTSTTYCSPVPATTHFLVLLWLSGIVPA